ncbi:MAG TPA: Rnase Y domain-containing protein, partial [Clostridia bacterium]|nr:Rnase Y domain-containing protein [Clostridia bacterium]
MTSNFTFMLAVLSPGAIAGIVVAALVLGGAIGLFGYRLYSQNKIGLAKREAARILEEANSESKAIRKEGMLEAKEQMHNLRTEFEKETKERKTELQHTENRLIQKESLLDKKELNLDNKQTDLENAQKSIEATKLSLKAIEEKLTHAQELMQQELERVSGMTKEEASSLLKEGLIEGVRRDAANEAKEIEAEAKENAEKKAKNIISL